MICWTRLWEAVGADTALDPVLLSALCGTEALFGISTQSNKTGVGQSKSKQEALGQITQGSCAWCRNPEGSSGTGENRNEDSSSTRKSECSGGSGREKRDTFPHTAAAAAANGPTPLLGPSAGCFGNSRGFDSAWKNSLQSFMQSSWLYSFQGGCNVYLHPIHAVL